MPFQADLFLNHSGDIPNIPYSLPKGRGILEYWNTYPVIPNIFLLYSIKFSLKSPIYKGFMFKYSSCIPFVFLNGVT
jgi:hypothetical protein